MNCTSKLPIAIANCSPQHTVVCVFFSMSVFVLLAIVSKYIYIYIYIFFFFFTIFIQFSMSCTCGLVHASELLSLMLIGTTEWVNRVAAALSISPSKTLLSITMLVQC